MVTIEDIKMILVENFCNECLPCKHKSKVFLYDGRKSKSLYGFELYSLISSVALEKINPEGGWEANSVVRHFSKYNSSRFQESIEKPEVILNRIFS